MRRHGLTAALVAALPLALAACRETPHGAYRIPGADPERGRALIVAAGCGACHVVPGIPNARGLVGPPLTNFGARAYIAGRLANQPDALVRWLLDPPAIYPGTAMPRVGFTPTQARDVAAYLYTLGEAPLGPPHLLPRSWLEAL